MSIEDEGWISVLLPNGEADSSRLRLAPATGKYELNSEEYYLLLVVMISTSLNFHVLHLSVDLSNEIRSRFDAGEDLQLEVLACLGKEAIVGCQEAKDWAAQGVSTDPVYWTRAISLLIALQFQIFKITFIASITPTNS